MKKIIQELTIILAMIIIALVYFQAGKLCNKNIEYYNKTEALLDSINKWNEPFMDTVMETDTYYEYKIARDSH